jgi:NADPH:quinone reductase-like Zn-dependent oxidoreductase
VPTPVPRQGEVLVKVRAVSLNRSDWEGLLGKPLHARVAGPFRPRRRTLGSDIAGRVEAVGTGVTRFRPGDDVFADILERMGGFAEYICMPERMLEPMPARMTYEQAAALPPAGAIAWQGIAYGAEFHHLARQGAATEISTFDSRSIAGIAAAIGAETTRITSPAELAALDPQRFARLDRPHVVEACITRRVVAPPRH